jgi:tRNA pseudouridine38-40 synthase
MTVRIAVAVGYLGRGYSGSQVQPNVPTIQGELESALIRLKWCKRDTHPVTLSSRTDGGVDARMNIGSFNIPAQIWEGVGERGIITALNDQIPTDIRIWAAQSVDSELRTRNAHSRTYLYRLQALDGWSNVTVSDLTSWCSIFVGEHDFLNFCRPQEGRSTVKRVLSCEPWLDGEGAVLGFTIRAEGFVWNQVRRIASAMLGMARGRFTFEQVQNALENPGVSADFGRAEPEWLTLWSIDHPGTPHLCNQSEMGFQIPLVAEIVPTGRAYSLWANKARAEQDQLHQAAWLANLNPN